MEDNVFQLKKELILSIQETCNNYNVRFVITNSEWEAFTSCIYEIMKLRHKDKNYDLAIDKIVNSTITKLNMLRGYYYIFSLTDLFELLDILESFEIKKKDIELIIEYVKELTSWGEVLEIKKLVKEK